MARIQHQPITSLAQTFPRELLECGAPPDGPGKPTALEHQTSLVRILGVDYFHTPVPDGGELFLTSYGLLIADHLAIENWWEPDWYRSQRVKLEGSGSVYSVPTKTVGGRSFLLVTKRSRVGETVPIDTGLIENLASCEFNSPFEEFSLLEELRANAGTAGQRRMETQLPLAIYVPPERTQPSQLLRSQSRIAQKVAQHPGVAIDIMRQYILVYEWLPGIDAWQACRQGFLTESEMRTLQHRAVAELESAGFTMLDMKPEHIIVQPDGPHRLATDASDVRFGVVDHELLWRTPEQWRQVVRQRERQRSRRRSHTVRHSEPPHASAQAHVEVEPGRFLTNVWGVTYVHGRVPSTGGMLWVVGDDPALFDLYLPERWRSTPCTTFDRLKETYFTTSKDNLRLVWKVSQVGERPRIAFMGNDGFRVLGFGVNSPFEEVSVAARGRARDLPFVMPLAIYRTGHVSRLAESRFDLSRFRSHAHLHACDGTSILADRCNYLTLWEHWDGPEPREAANVESPEYRSLDLASAMERDLICAVDGEALLRKATDRMKAADVETVQLRPKHVLVALAGDGMLLKHEEDAPHFCVCNFEYARCTRLPTSRLSTLGEAELSGA